MPRRQLLGATALSLTVTGLSALPPILSTGDQFFFSNPLAKSATTTAGKLGGSFVSTDAKGGTNTVVTLVP